jgi:hypothetical protein
LETSFVETPVHEGRVPETLLPTTGAGNRNVILGISIEVKCELLKTKLAQSNMPGGRFDE